MADYLVLTLDVADLDRQTEFWCGALRYEHRQDAGQYRALVDPDARSPKMLLQQVSEPKTAKNRLHIDIHVRDVDAEAERLVALGATRVEKVEQFGIYWIVLTDPEGNELCVVPS
jgi:predicted enzyme related to lactoylglutathione lyase